MNDILAKDNVGTVAEFAHSNVLLGFDFDGTLAPIVAEPSRARMRATTRRLLRRVATCYPCIVISGRTRGDLTNRLGRLPLWHVCGNHGLEPWEETTEAVTQVRRWVRRLRKELAALPGLVVQDKRYSVTVHYRHARHHDRIREAIAQVVGTLINVRALDGDHAVNLLLRDGTNKGVTLQRARSVLGCDTGVYVGDDGVDEDAFASGPPDQLLAIRVRSERTSCAPYYLASQIHIDRFLQTILTLRTTGSASSSVGRRSR